MLCCGSLAGLYVNGVAFRGDTRRERRRRPPPCRSGALHAQDRRSEGRRRNFLHWGCECSSAERMEARESQGRGVRAGEKEPADSWRGRDPHRALNLEGFDLILRFDREAGFIPGIEFSQVLSISNAGKNYSARRSFPSIKSASVRSQTC